MLYVFIEEWSYCMCSLRRVHVVCVHFGVMTDHVVRVH